MPESPSFKLREPLSPPQSVAPCELDYAELDVTTNFSFLRGASHPDELVFTAALHGYRAIAITDVCTLAGVVRAHAAAKQCGMMLIVGCRLCFIDGTPDLLVWCPNRAAYGQLCRMLTIGKRRTEKARCQLYLEDFLQYGTDLIAAISPSASATFNPRNTFDLDLSPLIDGMGPSTQHRLFLAVSLLYGDDDETHLSRMSELSHMWRLPLVATNHVHYHDPGRRPVHDVLVSIREGVTVDAAGFRLFPNAERYLKSPAQMHRLFAQCTQAVAATADIARRCKFNMDELKYEYPEELVPDGRTPSEYLAELTWAGAEEKYTDGQSEHINQIPSAVRGQIEYELALIGQLQFEPYFLTVYDLVRFARSRGILCQGRGSAANSAVCYCLGVTSVDPSKIDLLFERFVSAARGEPPDIDIDFEHERREEVIQYLYHKYGRDRAGLAAEVITYRGRSAIRDVGKALGLSLDMVDAMARKLDWWHRGVLDEAQIREAGLDPADPNISRVIAIATMMLGFPRHLGQHVGGMVMSRGPLCEVVPVENAAMDDRTVVEWDKDDLEELGLLKVDVLGLGMLTCISKAFRLVQKETKRRRDGETKWKEEETERPRDKETQWKQIGDSDSQSANVSRSDCLATSDGIGADDLQGHQSDAKGGAIRAHDADATLLDLDSVEHRRRLWSSKQSGFDQVSQDFARLAERVGDPIRTGYINDVNAARETRDRSDRGNGSSAPRTNPEPGTESVAFPHSVSSSLRLSVSSNQRAAPSHLQLRTVPQDDPDVYDMICDADTVGVFQIESRAQMSMLPRLKPRSFYDIVIEVAIVRPGPIQGNMVHPYLRRRNGEEAVSYPSEALRQVLSKTLGVPLFQEQAMRVAMVGAGFTAAEADQLRRAMAAWRKTAKLLEFRDRIINGMLGNGYTQQFAEQCFDQIKGFGEYGFPESHSASFALLVYVSAWLKRHHPAAFAAALINSQPMGFYQPAQIVRDARDHDVETRSADVNESDWDCTLEAPLPLPEMDSTEMTPKPPWGRGGPAIRLGLRLIKGLRSVDAERLLQARRTAGEFRSVEQFHRRTSLSKTTLRRLAEADAFASLRLTRREALWEVMKLSDTPAPLFDDPDQAIDSATSPGGFALPPMAVGQQVMTDYATTGLSLRRHPLSLVRDTLRTEQILTAAEVNAMDAGKWAKVAGLVLIRQRPGTASGIVFITLEDETGVANLIVRPQVYDRFRLAARHAGVLQCDGVIERQGQVVHIMAKRLIDRDELVSGLQFSSRDFH